jgi:hypothetical protein
MRTLFISILFLALLQAACNNRGGDSSSTQPAPTVAGAGNYCRLGPVGFAVESTRLGKVRMRNMMGQDGESDQEVFTIKSRMKLFDTATPVKQPVLQRDGMLIMGAVGLSLKDDNGREFKPAGGFGMNSAMARRTEDAILTADKPEVTDIITFESTIGAVGNLTLEVKGNWQEQQPDGKFLQPKSPGSFRIRIPRTAWDTPPSSTEAGPGNWATVGAVGVAVETVRLGKVKMRGFGLNPEGESADPVLAIRVRVKLFDPTARVKKPPFVNDGFSSFISPAITLKASHGEVFPVATGAGFDRIIGRQDQDVELSADKPEMIDLLTFSAKAAEVDELYLTLWPKWQQQRPDQSWADGPLDGEFRFRIPKSMWTK